MAKRGGGPPAGAARAAKKGGGKQGKGGGGGLFTQPLVYAAVMVAVAVAIAAVYSPSADAPRRPKGAPTRTADSKQARTRLAPELAASVIALQARLLRDVSGDPPPPPSTPSSACKDTSESCPAWASSGECESNPGFMHSGCPLSCGVCGPSPTASRTKRHWLLPPTPGVDWAALEARAEREQPSADEVSSCGAAPLLSPQRIPGLHVICRLPPKGGEAGPGLSHARLAVWHDADASANAGKPTNVMTLPRVRASPADGGAGDAGGALTSMVEMLAVLGARLRFEFRGPQWQDPALYTCDGGHRIITLAALDAASARAPVCLFEGGVFIWPPAAPGSSRSVRLPDGRDAIIRTLSLQPVVLSVENFLLPAETEHIISRAEPHLKKSGVALKDVDKGREAKEFRTSSQYFLPTVGDEKLEEIDARVQELMRVPITHAEYIQVLRYNHLEHYSAHHDYFDPKDYASNVQMRQETKEGAKNRLATVFFYLSDVAEGGATNFPRANGGPPPRDFFDCSRGLSVYPQNGKVIVFYSMHPSSELDPYSLHGGCDVVNGTKFSANFWLWNEPYHFASAPRVRALDDFKKRTYLH